MPQDKTSTGEQIGRENTNLPEQLLSGLYL